MSEKPVIRWQLMFDEFGDGEMVKHDKGLYVLLGDYVALERRYQDVLDAIERTGGLDNIRRVEVSQPVVIDMARENAFLKGENARLKAEVERLRKVGDALADKAKLAGCNECFGMFNALEDALDAWNAAKEGKQP